MMAGSGDIAKNFVHPGVVLSVANLIEAMITESDNSATDKCLQLAGGPAAVTQKLRALGIEGQRVDRSTGDLLQDFYGLEGRASAATARELMRTDPGFVARIPMKGVANDVGYITLADGRRFAIAVFTKRSDTTPADRDRAIAEVARVLFEAYSGLSPSGR